MDDEAHVGLVHPHAEGDGRHHHRPVLGQEPLQPPVAVAGVHARVIGDGVGSRVLQRLRHPLAAVARAAIDHAGLAAPLTHQFDHRGVGAGPRAVLLAHRRELQVRPGEAVDHHPGLAEPQRADDVLPRPGVRRGRDRNAGDAGKQLGQPAQRPVVGAEVMSPLRDAVRLVDSDQRQRQVAQPVDQVRLGQSLGRDIEQVQLSGPRRAPDLRPVVQRHAGIQPRRRHPLLFQRLDLVGHQGDQRRNDEAQPGAQHGGDLIADALAAAGGQHGQHVAAGQHLGDHLGLAPAEVGMAPDPLQRRPRVGQRRRGGNRE